MSDRNEITLNTGILPAEDEIYAQVDQGNTQTGPAVINTTVTGGTSVLNRATQLATVGGVLGTLTKSGSTEVKVFVVTYGNILPPGTYITGANASISPGTAATVYYAINIYTGEKYPILTGAQINAYVGGTAFNANIVIQNDYLWLSPGVVGTIWGFNTRQASGQYVDTSVAQKTYTSANITTLTGYANKTYDMTLCNPSPSGLCLAVSSTASPYPTQIVNLTTGAVVAGPITNNTSTPYQSNSMITSSYCNMSIVNAEFVAENSRVTFVNLLTGSSKTVGPVANTVYQPMAIIDDTSFYCVVTNTSALTSTVYTFLDNGSSLVGSPIGTVPYMGTTSLQRLYKICEDGSLVFNDYAGTGAQGPVYYSKVGDDYKFTVPQPSMAYSVFATSHSFINTNKLILANTTIGTPPTVTFYELF